MAEQAESTIRGAYQTVVIATAALRSWGVNWLLLVQMNPRLKDGDLYAKAQEILPLIKAAHDMIKTGIDDVFAPFDLENPPGFAKTRAQAAQSIESCLAHFDDLAKQARSNVLENDVVLATIDSQIDLISDGMTQVLATLDKLVAQKEQQTIVNQHSLIREAIDEMGKNNFTIGMIAINASVEAAHVGDAGRGFSVIASEIQNLSKNSKIAFDALSSRIK
ncbi:MAG: methyl-accepting chemotaxis protein [Rhodobacterales bacterium]|nr:methyl-accepting chemotaxis protein [Rhodobacterales bacterium]